MRNPLFYIFWMSLLLINCSPKHIKKDISNINKEEIQADTFSRTQYTFPDDWLGYWQGDLNIYDSKGLKQTVPMSLDLAETDTSATYTWAIIYGEDSTAQRRDYLLKEVDSTTGHYLIDEKNGIYLDAYHIHNELNSVFEVMGNTLLTSYRIVGNEMEFTVKLFPSDEVRISGDSISEDENIPKVTSYKLTISQVAKLHKKCLVE